MATPRAVQPYHEVYVQHTRESITRAVHNIRVLLVGLAGIRGPIGNWGLTPWWRRHLAIIAYPQQQCQYFVEILVKIANIVHSVRAAVGSFN